MEVLAALLSDGYAAATLLMSSGDQTMSLLRHAIAAIAFGLAAPSVALAGGGGGGEAKTNPCPWTQDVKLSIGGQELVVPQAAFTAKTSQVSLDGYELIPALDQLVLRIIGPHGDLWEASMTRLAGGKRCTAFYVGKPFMVSAPLESARLERPAPGKPKH